MPLLKSGRLTRKARVRRREVGVDGGILGTTLKGAGRGACRLPNPRRAPRLAHDAGIQSPHSERARRPLPAERPVEESPNWTGHGDG
ncbi:hypothetical protein RAS1_21970 [Phycisphaerae bacterium RAS1]|nr:hypothetical protein RAS1_21970 [Phycisphaerae bacterium RAS1]